MNKIYVGLIIGAIVVFGATVITNTLIKNTNYAKSIKVDKVNEVGLSTLKKMDDLPTTKDLEKKLVLGKGILPKKITENNTKIFAKNGTNDVFVLKYVNGKVNQPTKATVLTDEICKPDTYGYFHCWNNIKLSNGVIIRGNSIHDMKGGVPCLQPGKEVVVTPYNDGYFLLQRNGNWD